MAKRSRDPFRELPHGAGDVRERDGRWQARWTELDGSRHARRFDTADEANDFLRERWRDRRDGRSVTSADLTVADILRDWLERSRDDWEPTTYAGYRRIVDQRIIPAVGHLRIATLDTARLQQWIDEMRRAERSPHWIRRCVSILSSAYQQAMQLGIVRANPTTATKRPSSQRVSITTWTASEVAIVDAELLDEPLWHAVYRVALTTGMRPGELRALRWSDIDMEGSRIHVRRTMTRDANDKQRVGTHTKTDRERTVTLSAPAAGALKRWRTEQKRRQVAARRWDAGNYVFTGQYGDPLPAATWRKRHRELIEAVGVSTITLHGLRHTFATLALERNVHHKIVAEILGHSNVETTLNRYSHVRLDLQQAAADALSEAIFGSVGTRNGTDG